MLFNRCRSAPTEQKLETGKKFSGMLRGLCDIFSSEYVTHGPVLGFCESNVSGLYTQLLFRSTWGHASVIGIGPYPDTSYMVSYRTQSSPHR